MSKKFLAGIMAAAAFAVVPSSALALSPVFESGSQAVSSEGAPETWTTKINTTAVESNSQILLTTSPGEEPQAVVTSVEEGVGFSVEWETKYVTEIHWTVINKGSIFESGPEGKEGPRGPEGPKGATGPEGKEGSKGATGATGPEGKEGKSGEALPGYEEVVTLSATKSAEKPIAGETVSAEVACAKGKKVVGTQFYSNVGKEVFAAADAEEVDKGGTGVFVDFQITKEKSAPLLLQAGAICVT